MNFVLIVLLFLSVIELQLAYQRATKCKKNEVLFLHRCFCEPGWECASRDPSVLDCSIPLYKVGDCDCEPNDTNRDFLKNISWQHSQGYRCQALCRWNSQLGVPRSLPVEWNDNQKWKQLPFYQKDLPKTRNSHLKTRLKEFTDAFEKWHYLNGTNLGKVIEFGAGGYTQTRNILENADVKLEEVTLVDPQIEDYIAIRGCTYHDGVFRVHDKKYPTILNHTTVEHFGFMQKQQGLFNQYDTVIMMNVLEYSLDAIEFLETLHYSLKVNGLLIFHSRWFADSVKSSHCKTAGFFTNVLQVSEKMLSHFLSFYDVKPFLSTKQTEGQILRSSNWCGWQDDEMGYWAVVRKLTD